MRTSPTLQPFASARVRLIRLTAVLLGLVFSAHGQTASPAPSATGPAASRAEEVVTIAEFQVTESRDRDAWVASQAMSGTRSNAAIIDLPYQVQVLTAEFLEDFQLLGVTEQLSFFPGYSGAADQADAAIGVTIGGSSLRGFPQTMLRDGFRRTPPPQIGNTGQVEVIKGPMSTLYGDASPGGLINYVSKRPSARPSYSLTLSGGEDGYFRSNVTASGPLWGKKLFYLFNADHYYRKGAPQFTYGRQSDYFGTFLFKPREGTSLSVTWETVRLIGARAAAMPLLVTGTRPSGANPLNWTGGVISGVDWRLARMGYSRYGPGERYTRRYDGLNILVEHATTETGNSASATRASGRNSISSTGRTPTYPRKRTAWRASSPINGYRTSTAPSRSRPTYSGTSPRAS